MSYRVRQTDVAGRLGGNIRTVVHSTRTATREGYLQELHPDVKLAGLFVLLVLSGGSTNPILLFGVFVLTVVFGFASNVSLRSHVGRLLVPAGFALLIVAPQALLISGPSVAGTGLSTAGLAYVGIFSLRVGTCVSIALLVPKTTRFDVLVGTLHRIRVPAIAIQIFTLTYRYLVVAADELSRMSRGYRSRSIETKGYRGTWRGLAPLLGMFLLRVFERGERVDRAVRARGGAMPKGTTERDRPGWSDVAFVGIVGAVVLIGIFL